MAGYDVPRPLLDQRSGDTIIRLRNAFRDVEVISSFLQNQQNGPDGDPLTLPLEQGGRFGYTPDEAYLLRVLFESLAALEVDPLLELGRKLTGLD